MMLAARGAIRASGAGLPYDAEVEYLESTGTQYINTGIKFTADNARVKFTACIVTYASDKALCGSQNHSAENNYGFVCYLYSNAMRIYAGTSNTGATASLVDGNAHTVDLQANSGTLTKTIDGTISIRNYNGTIVSGEDFTIFTSWRVSGSSMTARCISAKIYSFKIWDANGVLVRDFIPVRKGTVGYLYDRVSRKLFGNAGTGDFVLGQDVVPVEWLGCDGSQYIDTKVVATNSHGFRVDIEAAQKAVDVNTRIFGAHEGNIRCGFALYGEPHSDDYFWGWNEATGFRATIPQRFVVSLNYKNDRAAIFNGTTNLSQLGTLGSMTQSVYLLNANYGNAPFANQFVVGKFYGAEITVGSDIANHYIPVRVGTGSTWEGAMMDVLTRRIYRNAGTGAFTFGNDLKYPIPA